MPKNVLPVYTLVAAGDMSGDVTSPATDISNLDSIALQLVWTDTPTGTFAVQGSLDGTTWVALPLSPSVSAAGAADSALIELPLLSFQKIRVVYTAGSGTGTLVVKIAGKAL